VERVGDVVIGLPRALVAGLVAALSLAACDAVPSPPLSPGLARAQSPDRAENETEGARTGSHRTGRSGESVGSNNNASAKPASSGARASRPVVSIASIGLPDRRLPSGWLVTARRARAACGCPSASPVPNPQPVPCLFLSRPDRPSGWWLLPSLASMSVPPCRPRTLRTLASERGLPFCGSYREARRGRQAYIVFRGARRRARGPRCSSIRASPPYAASATTTSLGRPVRSTHNYAFQHGGRPARSPRSCGSIALRDESRRRAARRRGATSCGAVSTNNRFRWARARRATDLAYLRTSHPRQRTCCRRQPHLLFLSVWPRRVLVLWAMRDTSDAALYHGVPPGVPGRNACFWQIRFEPGASGAPDRTVVAYRMLWPPHSGFAPIPSEERARRQRPLAATAPARTESAPDRRHVLADPLLGRRLRRLRRDHWAFA